MIFSEKAQKDAVAEAAMSRYFLSYGFKLETPTPSRKSRRVQGYRLWAVTQKKLPESLRTNGAEVVILCKVEVVTRSYKMSEREDGRYRSNLQ